MLEAEAVAHMMELEDQEVERLIETHLQQPAQRLLEQVILLQQVQHKDNLVDQVQVQ